MGLGLCSLARQTPTYHVSGQPLLDVLHEAGLGDGDLEGKEESEAGRGIALGNKAQDPISLGSTSWVSWGSHPPQRHLTSEMGPDRPALPTSGVGGGQDPGIPSKMAPAQLPGTPNSRLWARSM